MRYLVDTSVCVDALRRRADAERRLRAFDPADLVLSVVTVLELRVGAGLVASAGAREKVDLFTGLFDVIAVNDDVAEQAAQTRVAMRKRGAGLGDFDLLIAATALAFDFALITRDRDFLGVPGLRVEEWLV